MKFYGKKVLSPNIELIPIPRGNGEDIIFKAQGVMSMEEFEELCPTPKPPVIMYPGGKTINDVKDPKYLAAIDEHAAQRLCYIVLKSLEATEGLEWETVNMSDSSTWNNYAEELKESGFTNVEINRIVQGVLNANCLNEDRVEEARERFLHTLKAELENSSIQEVGPTSTPSGAPVNA